MTQKYIRLPVIIDPHNVICECKDINNCIRCKYGGKCEISSNQYFELKVNEFAQITEETAEYTYHETNIFLNTHIFTWSRSSYDSSGDPYIMVIDNLTLIELMEKIDNYFDNISLSGFRESLGGNKALYLSGRQKNRDDWVKIWILNLSDDHKVCLMLAYIWYTKNFNNNINNFINYVLNMYTENLINYKHESIMLDLYEMFNLDEEKDHINFLKYKMKKYIKEFNYQQKFGNFIT